MFCARAAWLLSGLVALGAQAETTVTGVDGDLLENVLIYLDLDDLVCAASPVTVERARDRAETQVHEALNAYGYYAPTVATSLDTGGDCWQAEVTITAGEPTRLRTVDIRISGPAAEGAGFQALLANSMLTPDAILNHGNYDNLKRGLLSLARDRGYPEARFTDSQLDIYPAERVADISLLFESGPRYTIGSVTVTQDALDPDFVDAYHELEPGVPYDNRLLTTAFLDLNNSGYFSDVDVRALPEDQVTRTIPVVIELTPAPRRLISYGIGFSTDTGPRLRFGRAVRRYNSRGHQLTIEGQLSPVVSELTTIYRMPVGDPRYDWLSFSVGAKREDTETSLARSIEAGVRRVIDRTRGWSMTQFVNYIVEDFEVGTQSGRPHLLIPGVDWTRIRGDDALRPVRGSKMNFEVRAANEAVLSDTGFLQTTASMKWIRPVASKGRVLLRGLLGYTAEDRFELLPPSIRFFAGGDQSIRGFDFESLGPVDVNGHVIGGSRLIELSAEYEHDIKPRWSLAVFADSGNAFDDSGLEMRTGAGIGARWRSPLGPVRIDVAWPVDDIEHGPRLHVSLGPDL